MTASTLETTQYWVQLHYLEMHRGEDRKEKWRRRVESSSAIRREKHLAVDWRSGRSSFTARPTCNLHTHIDRKRERERRQGQSILQLTHLWARCMGESIVRTRIHYPSLAEKLTAIFWSATGLTRPMKPKWASYVTENDPEHWTFFIFTCRREQHDRIHFWRRAHETFIRSSVGHLKKTRGKPKYWLLQSTGRFTLLSPQTDSEKNARDHYIQSINWSIFTKTQLLEFKFELPIMWFCQNRKKCHD